MKIRLNLSAVLFFLAAFSFEKAFAQDDRIPELDAGTREIRQDNIELMPEGVESAKIIKPLTVPRDSIQDKPPIKKPDQKDNPSVLSFNFLYYLIERFKLSDMVD